MSNLDPAPEAIALMPGADATGESVVRPGIHRAVDVLEARKAAVLHGLQLWIALPEQDRFTEPRFAHHADLPVVRERGTQVTVVIGEHRGERSPAEVFTPLTGLEVAVPGGAVPLKPR